MGLRGDKVVKCFCGKQKQKNQLTFSNGIDIFLGCAGFRQGDAGTPGKSIEMKVRQTSLMLP